MAAAVRGQASLAKLAEQINAIGRRAAAAKRHARTHLCSAIVHARDCGELLTRADGELRRFRASGQDVPGFVHWVKTETRLSYETAAVYRRIARDWKFLRQLVDDPKKLSIVTALNILRGQDISVALNRRDGRGRDPLKPGRPQDAQSTIGDYLSARMGQARQRGRAMVLRSWSARWGDQAAFMLSVSRTARTGLMDVVDDYEKQVHQVGQLILDVTDDPETGTNVQRWAAADGMDPETARRMIAANEGIFGDIARDEAVRVCRSLCRLREPTETQKAIIREWATERRELIPPDALRRMVDKFGPLPS